MANAFWCLVRHKTPRRVSDWRVCDEWLSIWLRASATTTRRAALSPVILDGVAVGASADSSMTWGVGGETTASCVIT